MSKLISAALASFFGDGVPNEVVYIPEGDSNITPFVNGKPESITVRVPPDKGDAIAATLQAALTKRNESNVRPWFDFEHKNGVASALPQSFRYEPGKGIMCAVEWTGAGRTALEGKDYSYLSPTFLMDDNGFPDGLPERGPLAALLNEPAFREIPRIAASDAAQSTETTTPVMSKLIFAALAISAAHADPESAAVSKIEAMNVSAAESVKKIKSLDDQIEAMTKERDGLKTECEAAKKKCAAADAKRASDLVLAAVADGRIPAKDTDKQDKFRNKIESGDTFAEEILAQLPKLNGDLGKSLVVAGGHQVVAGSFEAKAQALVTAGQAKTVDEALSLVAAADPASYSEYLKSIH